MRQSPSQPPLARASWRTDFSPRGQNPRWKIRDILWPAFFAIARDQHLLGEVSQKWSSADINRVFCNFALFRLIGADIFIFCSKLRSFFREDWKWVSVSEFTVFCTLKLLVFDVFLLWSFFILLNVGRFWFYRSLIHERMNLNSIIRICNHSEEQLALTSI